MILSKQTLVSTWAISEMPDKQVKTLSILYNNMCEYMDAHIKTRPHSERKWLIEEAHVIMSLRGRLCDELDIRGIE